MHRRVFTTGALAVALAIPISPALARGEKHAVDVAHSVLKIKVFKSGLFSAFGHDHEIVAPISEGFVETSENASVEVRVDARQLRVLDPDLPADKRAQVQKTMEGPEVLDSARFPEIRFRSSSVGKKGRDGWTVNGDLTLHGQTHPIAVEVNLQDGHYRGSAKLKQRDFGMKPVSVAGGTVKVKDEVKITFDLVLTR
ncbi:MAG TPA: YceI family protein [Candidatus Acidoferrales bacterium]|nr:YceI family protein [Candidatus Acidoferrales bacterium]